jgi:hypothetical protein
MAFNGTGANVTTLNASNISSGTVATARLGSGTANNTTFLRGDSTFASVAGAPNPLHGSEVFTSSGTFNVPTGVTNVKVTVIGAGGNGGNAVTDCGAGDGGGGGAGGYVISYVGVTAGGTATVTVGVNSGIRTSSFAGTTTITASGGNNGSNGTFLAAGANIGLSGSASIFGVTFFQQGWARGNNTTNNTVSSLATSTAFISATGGVYSHGFGIAGTERSQTLTLNARHTALGLGSGGGGGNGGSNATVAVGGIGTNGLVIVEW